MTGAYHLLIGTTTYADGQTEVGMCCVNHHAGERVLPRDEVPPMSMGTPMRRHVT